MSADFADLEWFYDALATALDERSGEARELFLARLVLVMASELGDRDRLEAQLRRAAAADRRQG